MIYSLAQSGDNTQLDLTDRKRKFCEIKVTCLHPSSEGLQLPPDDIRVTAKDLPGVTFPHSDAVELIIGGWDCRKILIYQKSICGIIYLRQMKKVILPRHEL